MILDLSVWWNWINSSRYQQPLSVPERVSRARQRSCEPSSVDSPTVTLIIFFIPKRTSDIWREIMKNGGKINTGSRTCSCRSERPHSSVGEERRSFQSSRWTLWALAVLTENSCVTGTLSHLWLPRFRHAAIVWWEKLMPHWHEVTVNYFDCVHPVSGTQRYSEDF